MQLFIAGREHTMKTIRKYRTILIYLIQPEDTTASGAVDGWETAHAEMAWLGPLKTVFWCLMAIAIPIAIPICIARIGQ